MNLDSHSEKKSEKQEKGDANNIKAGARPA
jgi:hypothetical protein